MSLDLRTLWDFSNPALSEERFRAALAGATGDDAVILRTQIARTFGLRRDFDRARSELAETAAAAEQAGPEARARYALELGRSYASATHAPEQRTPESAAAGRLQFERAWATAREAGLDSLAIDAIHMLAFIDTAPADQMTWAQTALAVVTASTQPDAQRWEAPVRHNLGFALHQLGRFDEALDQFQQAAAVRERGTDAGATRVAWWMVAWTLRALNRLDEAVAIQSRLEIECDQAGEPDPYVFEELETLHRQRGDLERAEHYASRRAATSA